MARYHIVFNSTFSLDINARTKQELHSKAVAVYEYIKPYVGNSWMVSRAIPESKAPLIPLVGSGRWKGKYNITLKGKKVLDKLKAEM